MNATNLSTTCTSSAPAHRRFQPLNCYEDVEGPKDHPAGNDVCFRNNNTSYKRRWGSSSSPDKVSTVKRIGGGSWLLGFVQIRNCYTDVTPDGAPDARSDSTNDATPPALTRSDSCGSFESCESSQSRRSSVSSTSSKKGVSFNESVRVVEIPHSSCYTPTQLKKMYTSSNEVRVNKIKNKKEFKFDGRDWRNATEECGMKVCMVTGELIHPVFFR